MDKEEIDNLNKLREFHGHLGPYVILGYLLGKYALKTLSCNKYFNLSIIAKLPPFPPESCLLDGLQFSTGCTLGKGNIKLIPADDIKIVFISGSKNLGFSLSSEALKQIPEWLKEKEVDLIDKIYQFSEEQLFESFKIKDFFR